MCVCVLLCVNIFFLLLNVIPVLQICVVTQQDAINKDERLYFAGSFFAVAYHFHNKTLFFTTGTFCSAMQDVIFTCNGAKLNFRITLYRHTNIRTNGPTKTKILK
jgi:hypothetical protein